MNTTSPTWSYRKRGVNIAVWLAPYGDPTAEPCVKISNNKFNQRTKKWRISNYYNAADRAALIEGMNEMDLYIDNHPPKGTEQHTGTLTEQVTA